jgi:hypothetical protein
MVSSKVIAEVKHRYENLKERSIDPHGYSGVLFDIAFEIITADTYIAGIASKILDRESIEPEERALLSKPLLKDGHWWQRPTGEEFDIQECVEMIRVASSIEELREKCNQALSW